MMIMPLISLGEKQRLHVCRACSYDAVPKCVMHEPFQIAASEFGGLNIHNLSLGQAGLLQRASSSLRCLPV